MSGSDTSSLLSTQTDTHKQSARAVSLTSGRCRSVTTQTSHRNCKSVKRHPDKCKSTSSVITVFSAYKQETELCGESIKICVSLSRNQTTSWSNTPKNVVRLFSRSSWGCSAGAGHRPDIVELCKNFITSAAANTLPSYDLNDVYIS